MANAGKLSGWNAEELRSRYTPRSRVSQGLMSMAPWVNLLLLLIFFLLVESRIVLQPGTVVDLPSATFAGGLQSDLDMVLLSVEGTKNDHEELIFFEDERYLVDDDLRILALKRVLSEHVKNNQSFSLALYVDKTVQHGTVTRILEVAKTAGVKRINMAVQPEKIIQ